MSEFESVIPDALFQVNIANPDADGLENFMVNAKYDRIDHFVRYGQYVLKIMDDKAGLVSMYISEETALRVQNYAGLPIVSRDQIFQSEYDSYLRAQDSQLENWLD